MAFDPVDLALIRKLGGSGKLPFGEETTVKEVLAECQPEFNADARSFTLANPIGLVAGEKYIVRWNGVDYRCEAGTVEAEFPTGAATLVCIGNLGSSGFGEDTGEPFCVADDYPPEAQAMVGFGCAISSFDGSTTLTISIRQEVTEVKKISGKYVEGMGYVEKSVGVKEITWDGNTDGLEASLSIPYLYKVSNEVLTANQLIGQKLTLNLSGSETIVSLDESNVESDGTSVVVRIDSLFAVFSLENDAVDELGMTAGTWLMHYVQDSRVNAYVTKLSYLSETETIHPIDPKFIVLTSPNGTQYKLSVADDGTLTATVVP